MGLLRMAARTAVVAGTATAVGGRVSRRQANRWAEKDEAQAEEQQAATGQPEPEQDTEPPAAAPEEEAPEEASADSSLGGQLQQLATLKDQGILSDDEFTAAKAKLLGI